MSGIHSTRIVAAPRKEGYVPHSLHGTTSLETQLAKRIKRALARGETSFDLMGDTYVKRGNTFVAWYVPVAGKDAKK